MKMQQQPNVAVLLATYNGARFVDAQIRSLADNVTTFTLHWLDDHSTDDTREVVRDSARRAGIDLCEWHQPQHLGYVAAFFQLLESADAEIYLFSDQDDIWQRGKIDAAVASLLPSMTSPVLCFSDPLVFYDDEPERFYPMSKVCHVKAPAALEASRALMCTPAAAQSIGITRPLQELFLRHKTIARTHAFGHDWWLYLVATAAGEARMLAGVPRTLWRQHGCNVSTPFFDRNQTIMSRLVTKWRVQDVLRKSVSRQAKGFILAAATLPRRPNLERLLELAALVETIDRRQSPVALARLLLRRAMWPSWRHQLWLAAACLWSDATPLVATASVDVDKPAPSLSKA